MHFSKYRMELVFLEILILDNIVYGYGDILYKSVFEKT